MSLLYFGYCKWLVGVWGFGSLFTDGTCKRQKTMVEAKKRLNIDAEL